MNNSYDYVYDMIVLFVKNDILNKFMSNSFCFLSKFDMY